MAPMLPIGREDLQQLCSQTAYHANTVLHALQNPHRAPREVVDRVTRARREQLDAREQAQAANPRRYRR
jgi:hypothetical protein